MLKKAVVIIAFLNICAAFKHDENYISSENESLVDLYMRTMDLSDFKIPAVDNLGLIWIIFLLKSGVINAITLCFSQITLSTWVQRCLKFIHRLTFQAIKCQKSVNSHLNN